MKKLLFIHSLLFFICLFTFSSCSKDPNTSVYKANAERNGKVWKSDNSTFSMREQDSDSIRLSFFSEDRFQLMEIFGFRNIPFKEGTYILEYSNWFTLKSSNPTVSLTYIDYDVPRYVYQIDSTQTDNYLTIEEISQDQTRIEGVFNLTFILNNNPSAPKDDDFPKVILYSNGTFKAMKGG